MNINQKEVKFGKEVTENGRAEKGGLLFLTKMPRKSSFLHISE
jgi:hypothetical protein